MKKIFIFLAAVVGIGLMHSCNGVSEYYREAFVSLNTASVTITEAATATSYQLPVFLYNVDGASTVTYTVEAVSATEGVDYTVNNASGVLNFASGEKEKTIDVTITGQPGVYTGDTQFKIKLASASEGISLGNINVCTVTIKDADHPLSNLFGDYTIKAVTVNDDGELDALRWTMTISPVEGSATKIKIAHITPFDVAYNTGELSVIGTVSADKKTITIAYPQDSGTEASLFKIPENFMFYGHEGISGGYIDDDGVVTFKQGDDGVWKTSDSYGFSTPSDIADYDLFYYYAVVFSDAAASYPTTFVKK